MKNIFIKLPVLGILSFLILGILLNTNYVNDIYIKSLNSELFIEDFPKVYTSTISRDNFSECAVVSSGSPIKDMNPIIRFVMNPVTFGCKNLGTQYEEISDAKLTSNNTILHGSNVTYYSRFWLGNNIFYRITSLFGIDLNFVRFLSLTFILASFVIIFKQIKINGFLIIIPIFLGFYFFESSTYTVFILLATSSSFLLDKRNKNIFLSSFLFGFFENFFSFLLFPALYLILPVAISIFKQTRIPDLIKFCFGIVFGFSSSWLLKIFAANLIYVNFLVEKREVFSNAISSFERYFDFPKNLNLFLNRITDSILLTFSINWNLLFFIIYFSTIFLIGAYSKNFHLINLKQFCLKTVFLFLISSSWFLFLGGHIIHGFSHISGLGYVYSLSMIIFVFGNISRKFILKCYS